MTFLDQQDSPNSQSTKGPLIFVFFIPVHPGCLEAEIIPELHPVKGTGLFCQFLPILSVFPHAQKYVSNICSESWHTHPPPNSLLFHIFCCYLQDFRAWPSILWCRILHFLNRTTWSPTRMGHITHKKRKMPKGLLRMKIEFGCFMWKLFWSVVLVSSLMPMICRCIAWVVALLHPPV